MLFHSHLLTSRRTMAFLALLTTCYLGGLLYAQAPAEPAGPSGMELPPEEAPPGGDEEIETPTIAPPAERLNVGKLVFAEGGPFMWPIFALSILVVTFSVERFLALRRSRVLPQELVENLGKLSAGGEFDPRQAYKLCQQHSSAAASVIRAMLLKVGRPHSEVEHTVQETSEREASRLYTNVRWLNLAAAVAPLMGLLGTVWGMIDAFHATTVLPEGANKADHLASGIYTALVTTLGGLCVAIPAAIMAHYFEGRIQSLFHQIDELLFNLLPQVERYEGRMRFGRQMGDSEKPARPGVERPAPQEPALK